MPPQALAFALAASIYPPAVVAVIALGRGSQVRSRVLAFVAAAVAVTYATGIVMLFALSDLGASGSRHYTPSAAVDLALGLVLIAVAIYLRRREPRGRSEQSGGSSKLERHLQSRRLAFVLGVTLYALPSPIYIGAVKAVADTKLSTSSELLALAAVVVTMLWLIELPTLMLMLVPARASNALESVNAWFGRNGRLLAVLACGLAGAYLAVRGMADLLA